MTSPTASPDRSDASKWARKGAWTVLDQALFAGANFLVNVLLARWLSPEAYGAFAVAFVVFLLVGAVHGGLFIEPMLVFGANRFERRTPAYLRVLLRAHLWFSVATGLGLAAVGLVVWRLSDQLLAEFLALGVASGFILALWLLRRACYVVDRPSWAVGAGALYLALLTAGAFALSAGERLTGPTALGLMAVGSVAASAVLALRLGLFARIARPDAALAAAARQAHAGYARWSAPTGALEWLHSSLPLLVLPLFVGLEGSGTLRALYNLAMPALQAFSALSVMALPVFVRARADGRLRETVTRWGGSILALSVAYGAVLLVTGRPIVTWLYHGKYPLGTLELLALAVLPIATAASGILMALLRSDERPKAVFQARAAAVTVASTLGVAATGVFGVAGALLSDLAVLLTEGLVQLMALAGVRPDPLGSRPAGSPRPPAGASLGGDGASPARLKVLMSAYACYPGVGSEPAVGWHMASEMAAHHDVWVLTYAGHRARLDAELAARPVPGLHVVYHRAPVERSRHLAGAPRGGVAEQLHYLVWQWTASRVVRRLQREVSFDLAHHVTFVKYWAPSAIRSAGVPYIWGPVGGGEAAPPAFLPALSADGQRYERRREVAQSWSERLPSVSATARGAALSFGTTDATVERMRALGSRRPEVRSAIGLSQAELDQLAAVAPAGDGPLRLACIGRQIAWKGYEFAVLAFAAAVQSGDAGLHGAELWLLGEGPEHDRLKELAREAGVEDRVRLMGQVPRETVLDVLAQTHALIQPSLHDSGGGVCLEAQAAGRPVLGLALGGTSLHVAPQSGGLVPADTPEQAVRDLAAAIRELAAHPDALPARGAAARAFAAQFAWPRRAAEMAARYRDVVQPVARSGAPAVPVPAVRP